MVHYKIYNKSVDLPFDVFCAAIRVPQWGSHEKMRERPRPLMDLYEEICQGRSFSGESGKIRNIHFPSIRYFAYFITKCVDKGMPNRPSTFAYLVFSPGGITVEGIMKPMKILA
jgi:hypothetical protein